MISNYVPIIFAVVFLAVDLYFLVVLAYRSRKLNAFSFETMVLRAFRNLITLFAEGRTTRFIEDLSVSGLKDTTDNVFLSSYGYLMEEIGRFHAQFHLPYRMKEIREDIRFISSVLLILVASISVLAYLSGFWSGAILTLFFAILINAVMLFPATQTLNQANRTLEEIKSG